VLFIFWPYRIEVSSPDFQSGDVGALPIGATNFLSKNQFIVYSGIYLFNNINYINYMNKTQLKDLIQECVIEVQNENFIQQLEENLDQEMQALEESNDDTALHSLCESLDKDAQALCEAHESNESLVAEGLITEDEINEGFFDTIGQFGKNTFNTIGQFGKNTFNSVAGAWKKAKAQGDEVEAKRLEKRLKDLKSGGAGKGAGKNQPVSMNTPPVKGGGKSVPSRANVAQTNKGKPSKGGSTAPANKGKPSNGKKPAAKRVIIKKVRKAVLNKLKTDDPEGLAKLKTIAKKNPTALETAKKSPRIKKQAKQLIAQIEREKPEGGNQGFIAKFGSWMKKNPIKTSVAIALLSALGTIAATSIGGPAAGFAVGVGANAARKSYDPTIATGNSVSSGEIPDFEE